MNAIFTDTDGDNVRWTDVGGVVSFTKLSNNGQIPDQLNKWVADGNPIDPYVPPVPDATELRREAYVALGWDNPFGMLEDILDRGVSAIKRDRDNINA